MCWVSFFALLIFALAPLNAYPATPVVLAKIADDTVYCTVDTLPVEYILPDTVHSPRNTIACPKAIEFLVVGDSLFLFSCEYFYDTIPVTCEQEFTFVGVVKRNSGPPKKARYVLHKKSTTFWERIR